MSADYDPVKSAGACACGGGSGGGSGSAYCCGGCKRMVVLGREDCLDTKQLELDEEELLLLS